VTKISSPKHLGTLREHNVKYKLISKGWNCERLALGRGGLKEVNKYMWERFNTSSLISLSPFPNIKPIDLIAFKTKSFTDNDLIEFAKTETKTETDLLRILKAYDSWKKKWLNNNTIFLFIQVTKNQQAITKEEIKELVYLSKLYHAIPLHVYSTAKRKPYTFLNLLTLEEYKI